MDRIASDLQALAGRLAHRAPNTENEREAAVYIERRLREYVPEAYQDPFDSTDSWALLFSAYYFEFVVVSILAVFFPRISLAYGLFVFVAYLAEFTGYHFLSRFLPRYASQNVVAPMLADAPLRTIVVTARYDSGDATWLSERGVLPWIRWVHLALVVCMTMVLISCATEAFGLMHGLAAAIVQWCRWSAVAVLMSAGAFLLLNDRAGLHSRGAVSNASGVAALLALAERLHEQPLPETDVWFLATGSSAAGFNGMHHFLRNHGLDKSTTYFLNLDHVGAGQLRYTTAEGMLYRFPCSRDLRAAADSACAEYRATSMVLKTVATDALLPLARGYNAMTIIGTDDHGTPPFWHSIDDTVSDVDCDQVRRASLFAEDVIGRLPAP